jgi:hypothetical protein
MIWTPTQAFRDARLSGGIDALVDAGADPAYAILFESTTALVTMLFAQPAVAMVAHELVFEQGDPGGDQILVQGNADNFELYNGDGVLLGVGNVTDILGTGALKVSGTTGTLLFEGARAILGSLKFT